MILNSFGDWDVEKKEGQYYRTCNGTQIFRIKAGLPDWLQNPEISNINFRQYGNKTRSKENCEIDGKAR